MTYAAPCRAATASLLAIGRSSARIALPAARISAPAHGRTRALEKVSHARVRIRQSAPVERIVPRQPPRTAALAGSPSRRRSSLRSASSRASM